MEKMKKLRANNLINGWDVVVSKNSQQVTGNWGVFVSNDVLVVQLLEDPVDLVAVDEVVNINVVNVIPRGVGGIITIDGRNINRGGDPANDFPNLVKGKGPEDGEDFWGDVSGDEKAPEESFLHNDVFGLLVRLGVGDNPFLDLDIDKLGLLNDNLGLSSDGLNDNFPVGGGNLDVSEDFGIFSNNGLVNEQSAVDFVQENPVVDAADSVVELTAEHRGVVPVEGVGGVGIWEDGVAFDSMSVDPVQVLFNSDTIASVCWVFNSLASIRVSWVADITASIRVSWVSDITASIRVSWVFDSLASIAWVLNIVVVSVGSGGDGLGDDLNLWVDVFVEEDWVPEVSLELRNGEELLEEGRLHIVSEDGGVFLVELTEKWDLQVLTEEWEGHQLLEGKNRHSLLSPGVDIIPIDGRVGGRRVVEGVKGRSLGPVGKAVGVGGQPVLQKHIILEE